jgi:DNA-binding IclR family transcriptional regulator
LRGVAEQAGVALRSAEALVQLNAHFRDRLRRIRARGQAIDAAESLIGNPYVAAPRLAELLGVTRQGAQYVIATLERAGIVVPVPDTRPALHVATEVLRILQMDVAG